MIDREFTCLIWRLYLREKEQCPNWRPFLGEKKNFLSTTERLTSLDASIAIINLCKCLPVVMADGGAGDEDLRLSTLILMLQKLQNK